MRYEVVIFNNSHEEVDSFIVPEKPRFATVNALLKGDVVVFVDEDSVEYAYDGKLVGAVEVHPVHDDEEETK